MVLDLLNSCLEIYLDCKFAKIFLILNLFHLIYGYITG